jgi:hypothetical protein
MQDMCACTGVPFKLDRGCPPDMDGKTVDWAAADGIGSRVRKEWTSGQLETRSANVFQGAEFAALQLSSLVYQSLYMSEDVREKR